MGRQVFEINGRSYDVLTGAMADVPVRTPAPAVQSSVDGIVSRPAPARSRLAAPQHVSAHRPQPTRTLMRRAVKTPSLDGFAAPASTAAAAPEPIAQPRGMQPPTGKFGAGITPKLSSEAIDPRRLRRAQTSSRNQSVQRFSPTAPSRPMPLQAAATSVSGIALASPATQDMAYAPVRPQPRVAATPQAGRQFDGFNSPTRRPAATSAAKQPAMLPAMTSDDDDRDLFAQALAQADSHEQTAPDGSKPRKNGKRRRQALGIAASAAVFLALIGVVGYQNREDIQLQLASAKAGFPASSPLYTPDGYSMASLRYSTGSVATSYRHNSQDITITQKKSNWNSQTLLENFVATSNQDYEGFQSNGRTVYVYGKNNATWVNGGIWYQIKATGSLSSEQLVKIAASM